jgi:phospholipid/cholesterol/gamma-HCH transport system substrate-binding protein
METRANYLLVGFFVLALAAAGLGFAIWLTKTSLTADFDRYDIRFAGSVGGLTVGAPVSFRGVRVGEVSDVVIDPETLEVVVTVEVQQDTPIRADTKATLGLQGLAGGTYILLKGGDGDAPKLVAEAEGERPVIPSEPSPLDQIIADAPAMLDDVRLTLARINSMLSEENRQAVSDILANISTLTGTLADRSEQIGRTIDNAEAASSDIVKLTDTLNTRSAKLADQVEATLASLESTAGKIDATVDEAGDSFVSAAGRLDSTLADISEAAESMSGMADEIEGLVSENRPAIKEFTGNGMYELLNLMTELRELANSLNRLTKEVERDPARFLFGNQQEGYEVPD